MTGQAIPQALVDARDEFDSLIKDLRPELHRYCARMTGSVVDGEDVVQEALAKAYYAMSTNPPVSNLRAWLFRIAHNKAIDHLRRRDVRQTEPLDDYPLIDDAAEAPLEERELAAVAMGRLLELTAAQRSCVFLKDVMEYSLAEISELHDCSVTAVKATLHRGRARLRELARENAPEDAPRLEAGEAKLLSGYVDCFNARDFDGLRAMLADDVRLDMVGRFQRRGALEVGDYFGRYSELDHLRVVVGTIDGQAAVLMYSAKEHPDTPMNFVLFDWAEDGSIAAIRDYMYARHVIGESLAEDAA
jgi:RNA polymerase sigma-70 factor (ECF subfamily)